MILKTTSEIIRVISETASDLHILSDFVDISATAFVPNNLSAIVTSIGTTTIVQAPAAASQRQVKTISIANRGVALQNKVSVQFFDGTTANTVFIYVLNPGDAIQYKSDIGWSVLETNVKNVQVLSGVVNDPVAPVPDSLLLYAKKLAGRMIVKIKGPSGLDSPLQAALWQNNVTLWNNTNATAGLWIGTVGQGLGTFSVGTFTNSNILTSMKRGRWANVVTTLNQVIGQRNTEAMFTLGSAAGQGGFFFYARAGFDIWTNGSRFFAGFATATTVVSANPSLLNNTCGFAIDDTDNGAIYFFTRDNVGTITKTYTGFTAASNKCYDLAMSCPPNGNYIGWKIKELISDTEATGVVTSTLPLGTVWLTANVLASNAALTLVNSVQLSVNKIMIETDF